MVRFVTFNMIRFFFYVFRFHYLLFIISFFDSEEVHQFGNESSRILLERPSLRRPSLRRPMAFWYA
jgi:hypothetical protein